MRFTLNSNEVSPLLVLAFIVAAICLFPNWDLVTLAREEGIDSLSGGRGMIVYIGLGAALFFVLNLALFIIQSAFRQSEYRSVGREEDRKYYQNADLKGAHLTGVSLSEANLKGAHLTGANLRRADLTIANLTRADLTEANLTEANLRKANLTGANLRKANLKGASLRRADLSDANLKGADLTEVRWDESTIWPEGFTPPEQ